MCIIPQLIQIRSVRAVNTNIDKNKNFSEYGLAAEVNKMLNQTECHQISNVFALNCLETEYRLVFLLTNNLCGAMFIYSNISFPLV